MSVKSMTTEGLENEKSRLQSLEFGGPENDCRFGQVCAELDHRNRREARIKQEGIEARGNQLTKSGVEFHVKGFEKMNPESQEALEKIVDAAAEEMDNE